jgi:predicted nicotinamide N-methyase
VLIQALALCRYLEEDGAQLVRGKRVIELGAGTGLVGLVAHGLGARSVDVTDRNTGPAEHNLKLNSHNLDPLRPVAVRQLTWGQDVTTFQPPYDVLLAADVVYIEDSFPVLIQSMADLSDNRTTVLLSCKYRYKRDSRFLEMLRERFVGVTVWTSGDLSIYSFRKRA